MAEASEQKAAASDLGINANARFIHLRVRSALSLLGSMLTTKQLMRWAIQNKVPALGVTDDNNMFAALELSETLAGEGVQPIIASTVSTLLSDDPNEETGDLGLFVQDETGYLNLSKISSQGFLESPRSTTCVFLDFVLENTEGLICTIGGGDGTLARL